MKPKWNQRVVADIIEWAEENVASLKCTSDFECDHCYLLVLLRDVKKMPPQKKVRSKSNG